MTDRVLDLSKFTEDERLKILEGLERLKAEVLDERERSRIKTINRRNRVAVLRIAADFLEWLYANERGATLSAFVNEFGYDSAHAPAVYRCAMALFQAIPEFDNFISEPFCDVKYLKPPYAVDLVGVSKPGDEAEDEVEIAK